MSPSTGPDEMPSKPTVDEALESGNPHIGVEEAMDTTALHHDETGWFTCKDRIEALAAGVRELRDELRESLGIQCSVPAQSLLREAEKHGEDRGYTKCFNETLVAGMPVMVLDCFECRKPFIQPSCLSNMKCPDCKEKHGEEKMRERCISTMINTVPTCVKECRALVIKAIRALKLDG